MFKITASRLSLLEKCPAAYSVPVSVESTSEYAEKGTAIHEFLQNVVLLGRDEALKLVPDDYLEDCADIDMKALFHGDELFTSQVETSIALDVQTGKARTIGSIEDKEKTRDYSTASSTEACGTYDRIDFGNGTLNIVDYKTGHASLGRPKKSLQLLFYAIASMVNFQKETAYVSFCFIADDGSVNWVTDELTRFEIDAAWERIRAIVRDAKDSDGTNFVEGEHCKYCPAFHACPAKTALATKLVNNSSELFPVLTKENFPEILSRLENSEKLLKKIREKMIEFAKREPVPLPDNQMFGSTISSTESINTDKGFNVLAMKYGDSLAREAVKSVITKTGLVAALRKLVLPNSGKGIGELEKEALTALSREGAIEVKTTESVKRYTQRG